MTDYRTYGETHNCKGCRYWSEMLARSNGGPVEAVCLNSDSAKQGHYTSGSATCDSWESGHDGAIDEPGSDPCRYELEAS